MGYISEVAARVDMVSVIRRYSPHSKINGRQFSCPFHGDDAHPSASIYGDNKWTCFTCNEHGDAVDFVAKIANCSLKEAADILNQEFSLGLSAATCSTPAEIKRERNLVKEKQMKKEKLEKQYLAGAKKAREYRRAIVRYAPSSMQEMDHLDPRYVVAIKNIDAIDYRLEQIENALQALKRRAIVQHKQKAQA